MLSNKSNNRIRTIGSVSRRGAGSLLAAKMGSGNPVFVFRGARFLGWPTRSAIGAGSLSTSNAVSNSSRATLAPQRQQSTVNNQALMVNGAEHSGQTHNSVFPFTLEVVGFQNVPLLTPLAMALGESSNEPLSAVGNSPSEYKYRTGTELNRRASRRGERSILGSEMNLSPLGVSFMLLVRFFIQAFPQTIGESSIDYRVTAKRASRPSPTFLTTPKGA
jgi:hypothetical protein